MVDPLTALLDVPRARDAFMLQAVMEPPWSVWIQDRAPLTVVAMTGGSATYAPQDDQPVRLGAGDLLLITRPEPYLFASSDTVAPQAVIHPGGRCETPDGTSLELPLRRGVRTWGNDATGRDTMLIGSYPPTGEAGSLVLRALPPSVVLREGQSHQGLIEVIARETQADGVGQSSLLDRLLDALTVTAIRAWAESSEAEVSGWARAANHPEVRAALDLMHDRVVEPWSVESLAREVGLSRAGFTRRFTAAVGQPPMTYLSSWRLALAADQLANDDGAISTIATGVGYTSPFTFSTAFKRAYGLSPLAYRRRARAATNTG